MTSPLQQIHLVHIHCLFIAEKSNKNPEADCGFGSGIGNNKNRKYLAVQAVEPRKRHQVQIDRVQNQLNRHQNDDHVTAGVEAAKARQTKTSGKHQEEESTCWGEFYI